MDGSSGSPITFIVPGQRSGGIGATRGATSEPLPGGRSGGRLKESVRVGAHRGGGEVRVTAVPGEDVVVLHIAAGPSLTLHPETARDLILAQSGVLGRGAGVQADGALSGSEVQVPAQLQWRGREQGDTTRSETRGFVGDVVLSTVDVITGLFTDKAADFVAREVAARVDAQVDAGVYKLGPKALPPLKGTGPLAELPPALNGASSLVFVHGTFSNTFGTFQKLWSQHPELVRMLFKHFDDAVYALDHPTLQASPIANAITLAQALPADARLHLMTHSRGGLVAEVLARVCANPRLSDAESRSFPPEQRDELKTLADLVQGKRVRVERIVRVACPARGTLLASKRLDAYLSVFKWTLDLAGVPVLPELVDFIGAVAQRRTDPEMLPGLAAQIPDSALVQWLHAAGNPIPGDLRVIAGDIEGDSLGSWLKTLLADGFYWTDNDFVVQTRSMYGGAPRAEGATFVLDQGGKVSHFAYFANDRTAQAAVNAVVQDEPSAFRVVGPLSWGGESSSGERAALRPAADNKPPNEKPALLVLPGMLGSNLKVNGQQIWLASRLAGALNRLAYDPRTSDDVKPDGLVADSYDELISYMSDTHETIPFAYDWRLPMEAEAHRLADVVEAALAARHSSGQPVRILAHSSGGLLARTMQLERRQVWERMLGRPGARLVMLGTPNGGSWTPMQVLSGDETFGGMLTAGAVPFRESDVRKMMAGFPGFLQLQAALLDTALNLGQRTTWQRLAEADQRRAEGVSSWHAQPIQRDQYKWGIPTEDALDRAVALRRRLDEQASELVGLKNKLAVVAGHGSLTPAGYASSAEGFVYRCVPEGGDGRVSLDRAMLPGVPSWTADCEHGQLPNYKDAFRAYRELLEQGTTNLLQAVISEQPARGGADAVLPHVRNRPSRAPATTRPPEREKEVFTVSSSRAVDEAPTPGAALHVTVINGDLMFVRQPLLLGHYRSMRLTGTELVMDRLVGHTMRHSLEIGQYPDAPGTHQIFMNTRCDQEDTLRLPRPQAVVVVGLGEEGKLNAAQLVQTVRQGVIAWAQRVLEKPGAPAVFDLAATLVGSGGKGIGVAQSAQLIAEAVREADDRLATRKWPRVGSLQIVELYLDRATEAWSALRLQAEAAPARYVVAEAVQPGNGALRRPLESGYRGADYDFITAVTQRDADGRESISYSLDTKRARTEVTAQMTQAPLIRDLVTASNSIDGDAKIGRTLFNVLVPVEIEPFLGGSTEMVLELDDGTAGIPWELFDTNTGARQEAEPWAIRAKVVRKLRTTNFRANATDASTEASVLVIGEPKCADNYPSLPGARDEANAVTERLCRPGALQRGQVMALVRPDETRFGPDARAVLTALHDRPWRIVHIAGHGEPPENVQNARGVVLSNGIFLGSTEVGNMRVVPELVFVNCCHLAARNLAQLLTPDVPLTGAYDRPRFAAGVAEALIKIGVRCVVAAGWAVDDSAAKAFATKFYDALLVGDRFIDAVAKARTAARELGGNTWAAYQCYGDPEWTFQREVSDAQRPAEPASRRFAGVASSQALRLALETIAVQSKVQKSDAHLDAIRHLEERFGNLWGDIGEVAEAFGTAWAESGDAVAAIQWYERALAANDGTASIRTAEQLGNQRARLAWKTVSGSLARMGELRRPGAPPSALASAQSELQEGRDRIREAIALLEKLVAVQPSMEREGLIGSAYKRLALLEAAAGQPEDEASAIEQMRAHYQNAEKLGRASRSADIFYPALNHLVAELAVNAGAPGWSGLNPISVATLRSGLAAKVRDDPDFWSVVGETELRLYEALSLGNLAATHQTIEGEFQDVYQRVSAANMWASVYDNAQFVLPKYAARAPENEKQAVGAVLSLLEKLAGAARAG